MKIWSYILWGILVLVAAFFLIPGFFGLFVNPKKEYTKEKGFETIESHARDFVKKRLAPAYIENDGSLTGIEPVWFEMKNSLPYCVKKA